MKKIFMALVATVTFGLAGGNIAPVAPVTYSSNLGVYAGMGVGTVWNYHKGDFDFSKDTVNSIVDPTIGLKLGWNFYEVDSFVFGAEGRFQTTINGDDTDTTVYSVFLKPEYFVTQDFGVYSLVGGSYNRWHISDISYHKTDFAFGLGTEYKITDKVSVSADWTSNLWNRKVQGVKNFNTDTATVWVNYKF